MKLYDIKAKRHGESYDAVSELSLDAEDLFRAFTQGGEWEISGMVASDEPGEEPGERVILHAELSAARKGYITVDFVRYENNRLGMDNKVVIRALSPRGELAASVLRGLKLVSMDDGERTELLLAELERMASYMEYC